MRAALPALIVAGCLLGAPARAQQADKFATGFATAMEGLGQSLGETVSAGQSVFVTATGRAPLPGQRAVTYTTTLESRAQTAVAAARLRDDQIAGVEAAARRFGVVIESQTSTFALEPMTANHIHPSGAGSATHASAAVNPAVAIAPPARPVDEPPPEPKIIAKTSLKFAAGRQERLPDFLDALRAAGAENLQAGSGTPGPLEMFQNNTVLGLGSGDKVDDPLWDQASRAAVVAARHQAEIIATAAGRSLGEVREIMVLNRGTQGSDATVTLAVRFAFSPTR